MCGKYHISSGQFYFFSSVFFKHTTEYVYDYTNILSKFWLTQGKFCVKADFNWMNFRGGNPVGNVITGHRGRLSDMVCPWKQLCPLSTGPFDTLVALLLNWQDPVIQRIDRVELIYLQLFPTEIITASFPQGRTTPVPGFDSDSRP